MIDNDDLYSKTTTHEFAEKIDAPRTSLFGKMDAYNFKGALVAEVEDAIAVTNVTSISQYFGGIDVVYKQSSSNNTVITPLFCPCMSHWVRSYCYSLLRFEEGYDLRYYS